MNIYLKNSAYWDITLFGSCDNRPLGGMYASIKRVTRIGDLGTTLAATSNRCTLLRMFPPKRRFLREPHDVTFQETAFLIVAAVKILNFRNNCFSAQKIKDLLLLLNIRLVTNCFREFPFNSILQNSRLLKFRLVLRIFFWISCSLLEFHFEKRLSWS
jgi:hypothetical protein